MTFNAREKKDQPTAGQNVREQSEKKFVKTKENNLVIAMKNLELTSKTNYHFVHSM